ncbi:MAG: TetR/AcrR family transcriptional regulator [Tannerellaceae bacterium]|jgi:AcrR family transcriptional regulator|nr:TetR/AcrR family transcriptional regulator [Tannerellaceae bacterium]
MKAVDSNMEFRILEAAEKLFIEQGFAKTSTGQIAKLAGCNQALVHYYYRTKDNLFEKIFEEKKRMIVANILTPGLTEGTIDEKMTTLVGLHFDFLRANPKLLSFVLNEIWSNPERLKPLVDKLKYYPQPVITQLDTELKKEAGKGNIHPISGIDLLLTIISLNVAPFLMKPVMQMVLNLSDKEMEQILEQRKKEVVETVLSRLRK